MKIRTSFVTNSSGSSSSRVKIENEVLYELLKKYQDRLSREVEKINGLGLKVVDFEDDKYICDEGSWGDGPTKSLFWDFRDGVSNIASKYSEKIRLELGMILEASVVNEIFEELNNELIEKEELIRNSYKNVEYSHFYSGDLGGCSTDSDSIIYDANNICPKCGAALLLEKHSHSGDDLVNDEWISTSSCTKTISCSNKYCDYNFVVYDEHNGKKTDDSYNDENYDDCLVVLDDDKWNSLGDKDDMSEQLQLFEDDLPF